MIKTLIFDLGRVLIPFDFQVGYRMLQERYGIPAEQIRERLSGTDLYRRFEHGQIEPEQFVQEFNTCLGIELALIDFPPVWTSIFGRETLLSDGFLAALHRNYRLLLLSNTNVTHFEMVVAEYPLLRHFDHFVLSYKVGVMKPDPGIYEEALRHAQAEPHECFFTDDIPENTAAARALGIQAVTFANAAQLEQELRARGVTW